MKRYESPTFEQTQVNDFFLNEGYGMMVDSNSNDKIKKNYKYNIQKKKRILFTTISPEPQTANYQQLHHLVSSTVWKKA